nr:tyrosine-type recombinase/integrase [Micromonospora sp. ATCC 39149]
MRHAFATFLLVQGEELRTVMELLGHSTIRMTADTYGHRPAGAGSSGRLGHRSRARRGRYGVRSLAVRMAALGVEINQG